jgi:hypothetical protein
MREEEFLTFYVKVWYKQISSEYWQAL